MTSIKMVGLAISVSLHAAASLAGDLPMPAGEVLLTVSGAIGVTNVGDEAHFDLEMLRALGETTFETTTPWTDGQQSFTGVSLKAFISALGIESASIRATALNDYSIVIPTADAVEDGPIISYHRNGEAMPLRDKGPLWIVYPYDLKPEYQSEVIFSRSIWQLDRIHVEQ